MPRRRSSPSRYAIKRMMLIKFRLLLAVDRRSSVNHRINYQGQIETCVSWVAYTPLETSR